jgi:hypothetical protein
MLLYGGLLLALSRPQMVTRRWLLPVRKRTVLACARDDKKIRCPAQRPLMPKLWGFMPSEEDDRRSACPSLIDFWAVRKGEEWVLVLGASKVVNILRYLDNLAFRPSSSNPGASANKSGAFWLSSGLRQIVRKEAGNPRRNGFAPAGGDSRDAVSVGACAISRYFSLQASFGGHTSRSRRSSTD